MRNHAALLALTCLAVSPAWAVNKCTGPDGRVVFQDAPCGIEAKRAEEVKTWDSRLSGYARPAQMWAAHRVTDKLTGQATCTALSPTAMAVTLRRGGDLVSLAVVLAVSQERTILAVRLNGDKHIFHNDLDGMGIKLDNLVFQPLDVKGGQHVVSTTKAADLLQALPEAKEITLRVRLWPYDELVDALPISTTAFGSAYAQAQRCAGL